MRRIIRADNEPIGSDSFLDVVTNIVGILIILVIVVGIRVKQMPASGADTSQAARPPEVELSEPQARAEALERDVLTLGHQMHEVQGAARERHRERAALAYLVAERERDLAAGRAALDEQSQEAFDLRRAAAAAEANLERIERSIAETAHAPAPPAVEIKSYPTPLSQTVFGKEAHFQLLGGRVAFIPLEELVEMLKQEARHKAYKLRDLPQTTDTVGPLGGFRLRYTLQRVDIPLETQLETGQGASFARLFEFRLIAQSDQLGEPLAEALAQRSQFRSGLAELNPRQTTITLWTYPDSFAEYRQLRQVLYGLGFAVAGRPLPAGEHIGGSPEGSRSAAQ